MDHSPTELFRQPPRRHPSLGDVLVPLMAVAGAGVFLVAIVEAIFWLNSVPAM